MYVVLWEYNVKKMSGNEIIFCCLNKAICFKYIHPTGTKNTSTLFYKQNFVSIFMISCLKVRCCKLTFSFWPISVHFNYMVPEMERTKEMKLWKDNLAGNAERRTTCILSCRAKSSVIQVCAFSLCLHQWQH